jgi:hypothetical protein
MANICMLSTFMRSYSHVTNLWDHILFLLKFSNFMTLSRHLLFGNTNKHLPSLSPCTFSPYSLATQTDTTARHSSKSMLLINSLYIYFYYCIMSSVMLAYPIKILVFFLPNYVCTNIVTRPCVPQRTNHWNKLVTESSSHLIKAYNEATYQPPNYLINPLKTKRRPLYSKTQSVPRCKHFSSRL